MVMQGYECNSCGYLVFVPEAERKSLWCPNCRATLYATGVPMPENGAGVRCDECGAEFSVPAEARPPYKCIRCNYTFPSTPFRSVRHKL